MSARHFGLIGIHVVGRPAIDVEDIHVISNKKIFMCMYSCVNNMHLCEYNIKSDVYEHVCIPIYTDWRVYICVHITFDQTFIYILVCITSDSDVSHHMLCIYVGCNVRNIILDQIHMNVSALHEFRHIRI